MTAQADRREAANRYECRSQPIKASTAFVPNRAELQIRDSFYIVLADAYRRKSLLATARHQAAPLKAIVR